MRPTPAAIGDLATLPALLSLLELAKILGLTRDAAYKQDRAGAFDFLLAKPAIKPRKFSGERVRRYLQGEDMRALSRLKRASSW